MLYLTLGVDKTGADPQGLIKVNFVKTAPKIHINNTTADTTDTADTADELLSGPRVQVIDYTKLTPEQAIELATGYGQGCCLAKLMMIGVQ